jgi:hypothetical protein
MDDQEIIKRILSGDKAAMRNLIDKYQELVVNTCYQVLHCREDAEMWRRRFPTGLPIAGQPAAC